jgi:hypothetical protein
MSGEEAVAAQLGGNRQADQSDSKRSEWIE